MNLIDSLLSPSREATSLLDPGARDQVRSRSLFDAGIAIMDASGAGSRGIGPAIAAGLRGGRESYGMAAQQAAQMKAFAEQQRRERMRREIVLRHPPVPGETPAQTSERLQRMLPEYMQLGDIEMVGKLVELLKATGPRHNDTGAKEPGTWVSTPGPDGRPRRRYVTATEAGQEGVPEYRAPVSTAGARPRLVTAVNPETGLPEFAEYNADTGEFDFTGQRPGTIATASEGERKAAALYTMAEPMAAQLDAADAPSRIAALARGRNLYEVLSAEQQKNDIAGRMIMDAYLRLTTGAAYNANEMNNSHTMLVPMPGDEPETLAFKRKHRQRMLSALRIAAGRGLTPTPGVEAGSVPAAAVPAAAVPAAAGQTGDSAPADGSFVRRFLEGSR